ncbi:hypothetical protein ST37_14640 [Vibrio sp. qd031]|uniref:hypothetical protein n=1 Tax=Vibrio sp. qd031 TaxID=1603038 RepID=UPI000A10AB47|nr:hypothetical protein [Vibrio sp. qd031]ORT49608.1 hypothetical protein ST37_14640 [Vibrio sp. qd031]
MKQQHNNTYSSLLGVVVLAMTLGMSGCGSDSNTTSTSPASEASSEETDIILSMHDLSVAADFDYELVDTRHLTFDLSTATTGYIAIYSQFDSDGDNYRPKLRYKIAQIPIVSGKGEIDVTYDMANTLLLAELWTLESTQPKQYLIAEGVDLIAD